MSTTEKANTDVERNQFGMFGGVFTPSILTILGVIMFMRTGFVVGEAGVWHAILILVIAKAITTLTGLSISAVSTNTKVSGGGAYFLISRSLGPSYGGAIGLALFLAQAFSVPFYVLGFVEALVRTFPGLAPHFMAIGLITTGVLFVVNWIGAEWAIKAQYGILGVLVLSIVVFTGGMITEFSVQNLQANATPLYDEGSPNFWVTFAIFFPAVTGIMTGVNMSGDLKDPAKAIPKGTLLAILAGFLVYLAQIVLSAGSQSRQAMIDAPYETLLDQALFGAAPLVVAGVFAATISSALGSMLGAPRILQALARDSIFPALAPFGKGTDKGDEPRRGLLLTIAMTVGVLLIAGNGSGGGALNEVASVLTMFFLYTYGMTNMAAFVEQVSQNPSFRPRFQYFHWITALAGAVGCVLAAVLIDPLRAGIALGIMVALFGYVERRVLSTTFGDARRGFLYSRLRNNLHNLSQLEAHPKNWRPTTLVLSGNPLSRLTLSTYGVWIESGRGIVTLAQIIVGKFEEKIAERRAGIEQLEEYIRANEIAAFPEVVVAPNLDDGITTMLQAHSIGPLKPNVVITGWAADPGRTSPFQRHLRLVERLGMSHVVVVDRGLPGPAKRKRIDVWWRGQRNGSLMVILAYLISLNWEWSRSRIRILRSVQPGESHEDARRDIDALVEAARIDAEVVVPETTSFIDTLHDMSSSADVVMMGFGLPDVAEGFPDGWHDRWTDVLDGLPTTLLVRSSGDADLFA